MVTIAKGGIAVSQRPVGRSVCRTGIHAVRIVWSSLGSACLVMLIVMTMAFAQDTSSIVRIPGDYPLPTPHDRVVIPAPSGVQVHLDPAAFSIATMAIERHGPDLFLYTDDGREIILAGFFESYDPGSSVPGSSVIVGDVTLSAAMLAAMDVPQAETAAPAGGPTAGGGGEAFGLLQVVGWLVDRLAPISTAQAQQHTADDASATLPLFARLEAQLTIARESLVAQLTREFATYAGQMHEQVKRSEERGSTGRVDTAQARLLVLDARLEADDAELRRLLAIDRHQDIYGERLESAPLPVWPESLPDDLAAATAGLPPELLAEARRSWRIGKAAAEAVDLLEQLVGVATSIRDSYREQYEIGQRTLMDLQSAEKTLLEANIRLVQRRVEMLTAQAWRRAAHGNLTEADIKHPGWQ